MPGALTGITADEMPDSAQAWRAPVFLQYTSGSTGAPGSVMVSHRNLLACVALSQDVFGIKVGDVFVSWLPPHQDFGLIGAIVFRVFTACQCVQFPPTLFPRRPYRLLKLLSDYRGAMTGAPNFA